jgi:hypothetical protein
LGAPACPCAAPPQPGSRDGRLLDYQSLTGLAEAGVQGTASMMTDDFVLVVTAGMLREAVRVKLASGTAAEAIWVVIAQYARNTARTRRVNRLPVEDIPHDRRDAFLRDLDALPLGECGPAPRLFAC